MTRTGFKAGWGRDESSEIHSQQTGCAARSKSLMRLPKAYLALACLFLFGCDNAKVPESFQEIGDQVKQATQQGIDDIKTATNYEVAAEIGLDVPLKTSNCYVRFISLGSGQPAVLQISSYAEPERETWPSFLIRSQVSAPDLSSLAGQLVEADMFVQAEQDSDLWFNEEGSKVKLRIATVTDELVEIELEGGVMSLARGEKNVEVQGKLKAKPL